MGRSKIEDNISKQEEDVSSFLEPFPHIPGTLTIVSQFVNT